MIVDVTLPQLGETADEAEILAWLKSVGDEVARGDPLLEVHTDKITVEVPALEGGVLKEILVEPGQVVAVGAPVARLERPATSADAGAGEAESSAPSAAEAAGDDGQGGARGVDEGAANVAFEPSAAPEDHADPRRGRVRASPSARRRARELGVVLGDVSGRGPNGRVTTADVERAAAADAAPPAHPGGEAASAEASQGSVETRAETEATRVPAPAPDPAPGAGSDVHVLTRIERATARSTAAAFSEMPHFYVSVRAEATELARRLEREPGVSVNDALVLAVARTLREHPRLNATFESDDEGDDGARGSNDGGERLRLHERVDIGVITATPEGVVTSVVRAADRMGLRAIHRRVREVRARAAAGRATRDDLTGATFCISNLGMYDVDAFSAILPPANAAILAVGALREEALVEGGALRFGRTMALTVSADHRALDGVAVALFLSALRDRLREPHSLFEPVPKPVSTGGLP